MENKINEAKNEAISHAEKKEFSKFADKVKTSLEDKLRNNPKIKSKGDELKNYQNMKDTFTQIKGKEETKEVPTPEEEPED